MTTHNYMCTKKQNWTGLDIYTGIYNDTQLHTYGTCRCKEMYWPTTEHENDMNFNTHEI